MRKILLVTIVSLLANLALTAQECSTTWPYLYPQFTQGVVHLTGGSKLQHPLNVHVQKGRLHYVENGLVKEAMNRDIFFIQIGEERYNVVNGDVMKVVATTEASWQPTIMLTWTNLGRQVEHTAHLLLRRQQDC